MKPTAGTQRASGDRSGADIEAQRQSLKMDGLLVLTAGERAAWMQWLQDNRDQVSLADPVRNEPSTTTETLSLDDGLRVAKAAEIKARNQLRGGAMSPRIKAFWVSLPMFFGLMVAARAISLWLTSPLPWLWSPVDFRMDVISAVALAVYAACSDRSAR